VNGHLHLTIASVRDSVFHQPGVVRDELLDVGLDPADAGEDPALEVSWTPVFLEHNFEFNRDIGAIIRIGRWRSKFGHGDGELHDQVIPPVPNPHIQRIIGCCHCANIYVPIIADTFPGFLSEPISVIGCHFYRIATSVGGADVRRVLAARKKERGQNRHRDWAGAVRSHCHLEWHWSLPS
jgi:hypothetical protein